MSWNGKSYLSRDRLGVLLEVFKNGRGRIGIFATKQFISKAKQIRDRLKEHVSKDDVTVIQLRSLEWLPEAEGASITHLIFVEPEDVGRGTPEREIAARYAVNSASKILVVASFLPASGARGPAQHYLSGFIHLDIQCEAKWLAQAALTIFAGPCPVASTDDNARFSTEAKVYRVEKHNNAIGLNIMTRQMDSKSPFNRIVLIKSFSEHCSQDMRQKIGKYSHIQSVNGILLDGLTIDEATKVFQCQKGNHVQLAIRYIHIKDEPIYEHLPDRAVGKRSRKQPRKTSLDNTDKEPIPCTVDIIGSNNGLKKELFKILSMEFSFLLSPQTPSYPLASQMNHSTTAAASAAGSSAMTPPDSEEQKLISEQEETITPMDFMEKKLSLTAARKNRYPTMQVDNCTTRAEIPRDCFDSDSIITSQLFDATPTLDPAPPPLGSVPLRPFERQKSISNENLGKKHFIMQMLKPDIKEQFAHLFLRSSGVYLLLVDLEDVLDDPMIHYSVITQSLNLLHAYLTPDNAKRIIVVGTYRKSQVKRPEVILKLVKHLSAAIANSTNLAYRIPFKGEGHVFMFDLDNYQQNALCLCACVQKCVEIIAESTYYKRDETKQGQFFSNAFEPFPKLGALCTSLSSMAANGKVVATSKELYQALVMQGYQPGTLPSNYLDSLSIYSSGLISTNPAEGSLLNPEFIVKVLERMELEGVMYENGFKLSERCVQSLPVVSKGFIERQMDMLDWNEREDKNTILLWMEKMELIIEVGLNIYFIPFLALPVAKTQTYRWSEEEVKKFNESNSIVLFAKLKFFATPHFFHNLIAVLIKEILRCNSSYQSDFISSDCMEAIFPLCSAQRVFTSVYLKYHESPANFIEFRAPKSVPKRQLLDTTQEKLEAAHARSRFSSIPFQDAISFHTLSPTHDPNLVEGPIWQLGCVKEGEGEDANKPSTVFPKTKYLASPGDVNTPQLIQWGSTSSSDKELPAELRNALEVKLGTQDSYWEGVASKLNLLNIDDINLLRNTPSRRGNGCEVMARWKESNHSLQDLVAALDSVGLNSIAQSVRKLYSSV